MVLPIYSEILEYGDSLPAATSLIGKDVRPFLKWTAEPGYDNHKLLENDCWCHDASLLLLKMMSGKKIAYWFLLVNAALFSLYRFSHTPVVQDLLGTKMHVSQLDREMATVHSLLIC